jgi:hypothetical protein
MSTTQVSSVSQSNPKTSTPDTWENRIQDAATFMGLSVNQVTEGLKILGVEKDPAGLEMLSDESITPFGDIRSIFCDNIHIKEYGQVPLAKVRMAMKYLRGPKDSNKTDTIDPELLALKNKYGIRMKLEDVDPSELLENYHPEQPNHPITIALKKRYGDKPIIVFNPDSKVVNIEETSNYIADLEQGFPEQETVEVEGVLVRVYQVGQVPNQMIEEDPLFEGKPLKRGRSIVNRANWNNVDIATRQLCRIIIDREDIDVTDRFQVQELLKSIYNVDRFNQLKSLYPEAFLEYREKAQRNELPKLALSMEETNGKKQDPFGINRKY